MSNCFALHDRPARPARSQRGQPGSPRSARGKSSSARHDARAIKAECHGATDALILERVHIRPHVHLLVGRRRRADDIDVRVVEKADALQHGDLLDDVDLATLQCKDLRLVIVKEAEFDPVSNRLWTPVIIVAHKAGQGLNEHAQSTNPATAARWGDGIHAQNNGPAAAGHCDAYFG